MGLKEKVDATRAALVEYYGNDASSEAVSATVEEVERLVAGKGVGVFRVNVEEDPAERSLVHLTVLPTVVIYRHGREEWRMEGSDNIPSAQVLTERLLASEEAPGAEFHHRPGYTGRR